jgi:hypothetical protein
VKPVFLLGCYGCTTYFPRNWEFGSALSKLRNFVGGVWTPQTPPFGTPLRSRVQKFPAWHTKAAPNWKCCKGYIVLFEGHTVTSSRVWKVCWNKGRRVAFIRRILIRYDYVTVSIPVIKILSSVNISQTCHFWHKESETHLTKQNVIFNLHIQYFFDYDFVNIPYLKTFPAERVLWAKTSTFSSFLPHVSTIYSWHMYSCEQ